MVWAIFMKYVEEDQKGDCRALKKLHKLEKHQLWKTCGKLFNESNRLLE